MFKFFSKKQETAEEIHEDDHPELQKEESVSVRYYINSGSDDIYLDIHISDYEDETLKKMAKILSSLSSFKLSVETMSMVKQSLLEVDAEEVFVELVKHVMEYTQNDTAAVKELTEKIREVAKEQEKKQEDQPWIKPSDIIK